MCFMETVYSLKFQNHFIFNKHIGFEITYHMSTIPDNNGDLALGFHSSTG